VLGEVRVYEFRIVRASTVKTRRPVLSAGHDPGTLTHAVDIHRGQRAADRHAPYLGRATTLLANGLPRRAGVCHPQSCAHRHHPRRSESGTV